MKQKDMKYKEYENMGKPAAGSIKVWQLASQKNEMKLFGYHLDVINHNTIDSTCCRVHNHQTLALVEIDVE